MSYFQDWLSKSYKPCCIVISSDKAKQIIAENNLTPSEFLRPFGDFRGKKIQIQFTEKEKDREPISLNDFILDFYDSEDYFQIKQETIINYVETMFNQNEPSWNLNSPLITKNLLEPVKDKIIEGQYCTLWFKEFEKTILECQNFDEYELNQQPLINIFVVHIGEKVSVINDELVKKIPKIIKEKRYDTSEVSIIIALNEKKDIIFNEIELEKSYKRYDNFKSYYKFYWDINCPPFADYKEKEQKKISDNFKNYFHRKDIYDSSKENYKDYKNKQYGKYINMEQYRKYREDFFNFFSNVFIPKMLPEKILSKLFNTIKKNKSFTNIFKKKDIQYYRNTKIYRFSELERAYYNLGLLYFYFHNYDLSNENLKLLRNSLKEKSDKHKNRVKELKAMSKFLQKKIAKKEFNIIEEVKLCGNVYQFIRQELIIIKMLENKLKENNKGDMTEVSKVIKRFIKINDDQYLGEKDIKIIKYFNGLLEEKLAVYNLFEKKFRKYVYHLALTGEKFEKLSMHNYALYCLSKLLYFIDNPSPSFIRLRIKYNHLLGEICNTIKYLEGSFKFFKNCFEFCCYNLAYEDQIQTRYTQYYSSAATQLMSNKTIYNNIDLNDLKLPQVDNASLFVLENDDYDIKIRSDKIENSKEKSWLIFDKYAESLTTDVYATLDEIDLNHIKLIHDLTNETNKKITNVHTDRFFQGNINQKLFVKCTITNPLKIDILISNVKLFCSFIPYKNSSINTNIKNSSDKEDDLKDEEKEKESHNNEKEIKKEEEKEENKNKELQEEISLNINEDNKEKENNNENKETYKIDYKEEINKNEVKDEEKINANNSIFSKNKEKENDLNDGIKEDENKNEEKEEDIKKKDLEIKNEENNKIINEEIKINEAENKNIEESNNEKEDKHIEEEKSGEIKVQEMEKNEEGKNKQINEEINNIEKDKKNEVIINKENEISNENKEAKNRDEVENNDINERENDEIKTEEMNNEKKGESIPEKEENKNEVDKIVYNKEESNITDIKSEEDFKKIDINDKENNKNEVILKEKEIKNEINDNEEKEKNLENRISGEGSINNEENTNKENENENKDTKNKEIDINDFEIINSGGKVLENGEKINLQNAEENNDEAKIEDEIDKEIFQKDEKENKTLDNEENKKKLKKMMLMKIKT